MIICILYIYKIVVLVQYDSTNRFKKWNLLISRLNKKKVAGHFERFIFKFKHIYELGINQL